MSEVDRIAAAKTIRIGRRRDRHRSVRRSAASAASSDHGRDGVDALVAGQFCRQLASNGRYVIRYDNRDTGLSTTYEPGKPTTHLTT